MPDPRIAAMIDAATQGDYRARDVAREIYDQLRLDPSFEKTWEEMVLAGILAVVQQRQRSQKSAFVRDASRRRFYETASAFDRENPQSVRELHRYMDIHFTVGGGVQRRLGDMYRADLEYAAENYRRQVSTHAMYVRVLEAIAERVGDGQVSDVYTEEELTRVFTTQALGR